MAAVEAGDGILTHIDVFTVPADRRQALVGALTETVKAAGTVPGWISAGIHKSFGGRQVADCVGFESAEAARRMLQRDTAVATSVATGRYAVAFTGSAP